MDAPLPSPPPLLPLAGHPLRWRLLGELARSDRVVSELTAQVGEPQNLVSYHLGKLREAGLVAAHRSDADRRDTYYSLDLARLGDMLSSAGGALHPGLRLVPPPQVTSVPKTTILFLCSGNSARSPMAEALIRARSGGAVEAHSAGSSPKPMHPNTLRVMREAFGLDLAGQAPKSLTVYADRTFDCVISLCDRVREVCPTFGDARTIHWSIANPATGEPDDVTYPRFQDTAAKLSSRIDFLLARLAEPNAQRTS